MSFTRTIRNPAMRPMNPGPLFPAERWHPESLAEAIRRALAEARRPGRTPDRLWLTASAMQRLRSELNRPWNWTLVEYDGVPVHLGSVSMVTYASSAPGGNGMVLL